MKRNRVIAATLVAAAFLLPACSSSGSDSGSKSTTTAGGVKITTPASAVTINAVVSDTKGTDGPMTMTVDTATVKAGKVTFTMKNTGTIEHEMIVIKTDTPVDQLKVQADHRVSEADSVGEVSETKAGATKSVTLDLEPGNYALVCNIAKHYEMGMYAALKVT